jgi:hypothetical protein
MGWGISGLAVALASANKAIHKLGSESCSKLGFSETLMCSACSRLSSILADVDDSRQLLAECHGCCQADEQEFYFHGKLYVCPHEADQNQDLHHFINRELPKFPAVSVEYIPQSRPMMELIKEDEQKGDFTNIDGWKAEELVELLKMRMKNITEAELELIRQGKVVKAQFTDCRRCRYRFPQELHDFILQDAEITYQAVKVVREDWVSPKLTLYDDEGKVKEVVDLSSYSDGASLHQLLESKGIPKKTSTYRGEIRTCSG